MLLVRVNNFLGYPFKHKEQHTSHKSGICTRCSYLVGEVSMLIVGVNNFLGYPFKHKEQHTSHKSGIIMY